MDLQLDQLTDRRTAPRLETELRARYSDYGYEWEGRCTSVCVQGCFMESEEPFEAGKELQVTFFHPDGDELTLDAIVRWHREPTSKASGGMGIAFDLRERRSAELATDFVERLALEDIITATQFRDAGRPLSITAVLHHARNAPANPVLTDAERTLLAWLDGNRDLRSVRNAVGDETWDRICYTPFSLIGKGVVTTEQSLAASPAQLAGKPAGKASASAGPVADVGARNEQAHAHFGRALEAMEANDRRRALTEARLAIMLAPGDAEITSLLQELED